MTFYKGMIPHNFEDLSGRKFNNLTVLSVSKERGGGYWDCVCDCGNYTTVSTGKLKSGHTKSCGCLNFGKIEEQIDLTVKRKHKGNVDFSDTKIYKITNIVNGKIYIGQTTNSIRRRYCSHFLKNSGCIKLKNAINKYGKESFIIELIDHAHSQEEANYKEKMYISMYNSTNDKYGYNITSGGNTVSSTVTKRVMCLETGEIFDSIVKAYRKYKRKSGSALSSVCCGKKNTFCGKHWAFIDDNNKPILDNIRLDTLPRKIKVRCVETGEVFNSISDAGREKNCNIAQIGQVLNCKRNVKTAGGFHWEYVDKENPKRNNYISKNKNKVKVLCVDTGKVYNSISECAKEHKVCRSSIYNSLNYGDKCKNLNFIHYKEK